MVKVKTFIQALNTFHQDYKKFFSFLNDNRITQTEKRILKAWINLREVKLQDIIQDLAELRTTDSVVESQRQFLLGVAYNNTGDLVKAITCLESALKLLKDVPLERQKFVALNTLFIAYQNLKNEKSMAHVLDLMQDCKDPSVPRQIETWRREFSYLCFTGQLSKARRVLSKVEKFAEQFDDSQKLNFLMDKFDLAIKSENYSECHDLMEQMKKHRHFNLSPNFKFMRKVLGLIENGDPLYLYAKDFEEIPLLHCHVQVLLSLESQDFQTAKDQWKKLEAMSPGIYLDDFSYHGDKCLFSLAVERLTPKKQFNPTQIEKGSLNNEELFLKIIQDLDGQPISKEELFYSLWGKKLESKDDLNRLVCTVYRLKTKHKLNIKSKKSCYFLDKSPKKAS